jgi:UDP-glucose 4-epimerase
MRLLITGGTGYIGSVVSEHLVLAGHRLVVLDNLRTSAQTHLPPDVRLCVGDVSDRAILEQILPGVDAVLHFAASIEVGESMHHPIRHFRNNTEATIVLLEAMADHNVSRFLFSSTAALYGDPEEIPVTEDHPLRPANPYGESKLMVERILAWLHQRNGLRYASLRYFNAAGGRPKEKAVNLLPIVLEVALGRRPHLTIFGTDYPTKDGTAVRDYVHVEDLASAHLLALHALDTRGQRIYNLGSGTGYTVREVVEAARTVTGHPIPVVEAPRRPGDPAEVVASSDLIRQELGWAPRYSSLESIVRNAWEHMSADTKAAL